MGNVCSVSYQLTSLICMGPTSKDLLLLLMVTTHVSILALLVLKLVGRL
jgi:hypothetical protein